MKTNETGTGVSPAQTSAQQRVLDTFQWKKVKAPRIWRPKDVGTQLVGYYGGRTKRDGVHGQYEVVLVLVPVDGVFMVSGTMLIQLLDAAMLSNGDAMRIVYMGREALDSGREMKCFEVYVSEGPAVSAETVAAAVPAVQ